MCVDAAFNSSNRVFELYNLYEKEIDQQPHSLAHH